MCEKQIRKFLMVENKLPSLSTQTTFLIPIVGIEIALGVFLVIKGYNDPSNYSMLINVGYGLYISAMCTGAYVACRILVNILRLMIINFRINNTKIIEEYIEQKKKQEEKENRYMQEYEDNTEDAPKSVEPKNSKEWGYFDSIMHPERKV